MIGEPQQGHAEPELYVTPFVGYRAWLMTDALELTSCIFSSHVFRHDTDIAAECLSQPKPGTHAAPGFGCICGYWSFSTYEGLGTFAIWGGGRFVRAVRGLCLGWGRMVLCERGWRAQYVRPVALLEWPERSHRPRLPDDDPSVAGVWNDRAERIADRYRVPYVSDVVSLEAIAHDHGAATQ